MADPLAPFCAHVSHHVGDPDRWKAGFDDLEGARRDAGILGHHINRARDDPTLITVFLPLTDLDHAASFMADYERRDVMQVLGIESEPRIEWLAPISEALVQHRQVPALLIPVRIVDLDVWLADHDTVAALRRGAGIIGHAVRRSLDDPASIRLYHQAETFDALHDFLADPTTRSGLLAGSMECEAGASFHTAGWAKTY